MIMNPVARSSSSCASSRPTVRFTAPTNRIARSGILRRAPTCASAPLLPVVTVRSGVVISAALVTMHAKLAENQGDSGGTARDRTAERNYLRGSPRLGHMHGRRTWRRGSHSAWITPFGSATGRSHRHYRGPALPANADARESRTFYRDE